MPPASASPNEAASVAYCPAWLAWNVSPWPGGEDRVAMIGLSPPNVAAPNVAGFVPIRPGAPKVVPPSSDVNR